jgi:preprotein translocase SecE subunit
MRAMASKSGEKVTRISAKTTAATKDSKKVSKKSPRTKTSKDVKVRKEPTNPFVKTLFAIGGYFKGAWTELRLVRWPTRRATWGLTFAVILFSGFFVVVILLLDILFKYLFELILK